MKHTKFNPPLPALLAVALTLAVAGNPGRTFADDAAVNSSAETNAPTVAPGDSGVTEITNEPTSSKPLRVGQKFGRRGQDLVVFGRTVELKAGETANDLVVIGGSAIMHGKVNGNIVAIFGSVTADGEVNRDAVAVLGNVQLGTNSFVHGNAVAVGGSVRMAPGAKINRDAVAVGGAVERAEGDEINGKVLDLGGFTRLGDWLEQCVFKLRPLSLRIGWVWAVAGLFALGYFLIALAFPWPVKVCVNEVRTRPATTFLIGLLLKISVPVIVIILAATGIGLLVVPILFAALFVAVIFGKVALMEHLGGGLGKVFGFEMTNTPLAAFLLGIAMITLLYLVPVLGFVTYAVLGMWGAGAAVTALFSGMRRERRAAPPAPTGFPSANPPGTPPTTVPPMAFRAGAGEGVAAAATTAPLPEPPRVAPLPVMLTYPRAGFWERMGAAFLDLVLLCIPAMIVGPFVLIVALAYFAGMWAWKGTTIGGIVLKLQVVRYDGGPVNFLVALVRALAAAFSALVFLIGFFWIGWDRDKQGWHDKIAGTVVVRVPHSMPLVCL